MEDSGYDLEEGYLSLTTDHRPTHHDLRFTIHFFAGQWDK
jgi:hypothetical protein